jgi:PAS domain S-box-containing protein
MRDQGEGLSSALSHASDDFSEALLDYPRLLATVARAISTATDAACVVRLLSPDEAELDAVASFHADDELGSAARALAREMPSLPVRGPWARIVSDGQPLSLAAASDEVLRELGPGHEEVLGRHDLRHVRLEPLVARGSVLGTLTLARPVAGAPFTSEDAIVVREVAARAALALHNGRQVQATRALSREHEDRFHSLFVNALDAILLIDDETGHIVTANPAACQMFRSTEVELQRRNTLADPSDPRTETAKDEWARRASFRGELCFVRGDGTRFEGEVAVSTYRRADGRRKRIVTLRDITSRRSAEARVREANHFLDSVIENLPHMIFVKDAERLAFVRVNRAGEELIGLPRAELVDRTDHDFFPPEQAAFFQAKDREVLDGRKLVEIAEERIETARGPRLLSTKKVPILDDAGVPRYLLGISQDISDRKAAEEARARLAAIVDGSEDALFGTTTDGVVTTWNRSAGRMFGYAEDDMLGRSTEAIVPPRVEAEERAIAKRVAAGERVAPFETVRRRRDGQEIDVYVSVSPVHDAAGNVVGLSQIVRDVSEAKRAQREIVRAKAALEAANRELESFSYSVAHDLRAPLRSIDGFSQALLEDYGETLDAEGKKYLRYVRESAQLMAQLIDDMLTLSRVARTELRRDVVDLSALARAAQTRLSRQQPGRRVVMEIHEDLVADGDPRLLAVVVDNLVDNAWKFTSKRADARIEIGATETDGARTFFVRDNGAGFDMTYADKLFGVFQRLHSAHEFEGTGVGLATVQRIVHRHGGRVWAEGSVGKGATFHFTLGEKDQSP